MPLLDVPAGAMTTREDVLRALEGCTVVSYPSLLERLRAIDVQPAGMLPVLDRLRADGTVELLTRQGERWVGFGEDRGPMFVRVVA